MNLPALSISPVAHVGFLDRPRKKSWESWEGGHLSVSRHPEAWRKIARLDGPLWHLVRKDGQPGVFVDMLSLKRKDRITIWKASRLVRPARVWALIQLDENDRKTEQLFYSKREALLEAGEGEEDGFQIQERMGLSPRPELERRWEAAFTSKLREPLLVQEYALIEALSDLRAHDGCWWRERLSVDNYSAPRGCIFDWALPAWSFSSTETSEGG